MKSQTADWGRTIFLHTGWTRRYDGSEEPQGGHAYLKGAIGIEAENFRNFDGWCYGYAPVGRSSEGRGLSEIPESLRTLHISKLGAPRHAETIDGVTVVWTARHPENGPVVVGLYDDATVLHHMPTGKGRPFIAQARSDNCRLVPHQNRLDFQVPHKQRGFPGMAAAWFPGRERVDLTGAEQASVASFLARAAGYLDTIRRTFRPVSAA